MAALYFFYGLTSHLREIQCNPIQASSCSPTTNLRLSAAPGTSSCPPPKRASPRIPSRTSPDRHRGSIHHRPSRRDAPPLASRIRSGRRRNRPRPAGTAVALFAARRRPGYFTSTTAVFRIQKVRKGWRAAGLPFPGRRRGGRAGIRGPRGRSGGCRGYRRLFARRDWGKARRRRGGLAIARGTLSAGRSGGSTVRDRARRRRRGSFCCSFVARTRPWTGSTTAIES